MLAWAFHRISGVAIWAFVLLHVLDIWLVGANPSLYDDVLKLYASPLGSCTTRSTACGSSSWTSGLP
jgi:succinate dehydrogenase/fumarate reductase cytochrome b subunit